MRCFKKVSLEEFNKYYSLDLYDFNLPVRSTFKSAGYDFFSPSDFVIKAGESIKIVSGVKACMEERDVLYLFIRSSLAIKYGLVLKNCVGVIDSDYYNNVDNEGNIIFVIENTSESDFEIKRGMRIVQGVFMNYLITDNDNSNNSRNGGIGSTLLQCKMS